MRTELRLVVGFLTGVFFLLLTVPALSWSPLAVTDDPLVRMPGTQPAQGVRLEGPGRCMNCHAGYNSAVEPGFNWKGSMMAQAARDPMMWACLTVAAQDSIWALGNPNAADLCERCHFPEGWLGGRSDPPNASAMSGTDFDGLHCDFCHTQWDPFFEATANGTREGSDWKGYWDEATSLSLSESGKTYLEDRTQSEAIQLFRPASFYLDNHPKYRGTYLENGSGQYFVSSNSQKRAGFADAGAKHQMLYSRYHKSRYFCATCHDVSNPVLANLRLSGLDDQSGGTDLITEQYSAASYFHVERTFSEFMLSAYGREGGAATNAEFQAQGAPEITWAAKCQDCHMRDVTGRAANKTSAVLRSDESTEHPASGLPLHDLTGGNAWVSHILASLDPNGPVYDPVNARLLDQGPAVLTLDLNQGESPKVNGAALKAGSDRAIQQLQLAATIKDLDYSPGSGALTFKVQNNTGHKLTSGFPEGRRMFVNVKAYKEGAILYELNPYDYAAGTLKGLPHPSSPALADGEAREDALVYEVHPTSSLTGEQETFHFVLATGRYKDNRIPPKGFDINGAPARLSEPVWHGSSAADYFTPAEYAGGYDEVSLVIPAGADRVDVSLYYQGTSREYVEFLRDEINGTADTLSSPAPSGEPKAYVVQTDPFFSKLKAWGDTLWELWRHNHGLDGSGKAVAGIVPLPMSQSAWGAAPAPCDAPVPVLGAATPGHGQVTLSWSDEHTNDPGVIGYRIYYDQSGKSQLVADVALTSTFIDSGLTNGQEYCYKVTSLYSGCESAFSGTVCAVPENNVQSRAVVSQLQTGRIETVGKGKNQTTTTFTLTDTFYAGEDVVIRASVLDADTGLPLADAVVDLSVSGPETAALTTGASDSSGIAEAIWKTSAGNRKGDGATTPGIYTVTVTNLTLDEYVWDGGGTTVDFTLQ